MSQTRDCYGHVLLQSLSLHLGLSAKRQQCLIQHSSTSSQVCIEHRQCTVCLLVLPQCDKLFALRLFQTFPEPDRKVKAAIVSASHDPSLPEKLPTAPCVAPLTVTNDLLHNSAYQKAYLTSITDIQTRCLHHLNKAQALDQSNQTSLQAGQTQWLHAICTPAHIPKQIGYTRIINHKAGNSRNNRVDVQILETSC